MQCQHQRFTVSRFLLIGSERSGSTMFRLMLDHHPAIACMYESDFMVTPYARLRAQPVSKFANAIKHDWIFQRSGLTFPDEARTYTEAVASFFRQRGQHSAKRIVGATIQRAFHHLPELFPTARYIHLVRDGRPVAASIVNMGWAGNTYYGALRWQRTIRHVLALESQIEPERWLTVRYENLVREPKADLTRVCNFLGVEFSDEMLHYPGDSTYDAPEPSRAGLWQSRMSPREIQECEMACGETLERVGYQRLFSQTEPNTPERALLYLSHRSRRWRFHCSRFGTYLMLSRKLWRMAGVRRERLERRYAMIRGAHVK